MQTTLRSMDLDVSDTTFADVADEIGQAWQTAVTEVVAGADSEGGDPKLDEDLWPDPTERRVASARLAAVQAVIRSVTTAPTKTPYAAVSDAFAAAWDGALEPGAERDDGGQEVDESEAEAWIAAEKLAHLQSRSMKLEDWADVKKLAAQLRASIENVPRFRAGGRRVRRRGCAR